MATITNNHEEGIDIIFLEGVLDDESLLQLRDMITTLRQQKSTRLMIQGEGLEKIDSHRLEVLNSSIRIYREMMGIIVLTGFPQKELDRIRRSSWYRYLNIFKTREEARNFLLPKK
ncbi:MAG: STAS domain-containing protein [bacterium]|jgi:ABC-type transporter Mla MlaB component